MAAAKYLGLSGQISSCFSWKESCLVIELCWKGRFYGMFLGQFRSEGNWIIKIILEVCFCTLEKKKKKKKKKTWNLSANGKREPCCSFEESQRWYSTWLFSLLPVLPAMDWRWTKPPPPGTDLSCIQCHSSWLPAMSAAPHLPRNNRMSGRKKSAFNTNYSNWSFPSYVAAIYLTHVSFLCGFNEVPKSVENP